jgi:electron transport complex protein RnfG
MPVIKSSFLNMLLTLTGVTLAASLALGFVYQWTKKPIEEAMLAKQLKAIEAVVQGYNNNPVQEKFKVATLDGKDSLEFFPAKLDNKLLGVAVKTRSSRGYSGDIWIMVGFLTDGTIQDIFVIQHLETPGLGSKMADPLFRKQFSNKNPERSNLKVKKDGGEIDAISGATISSRAFSEAVLKAYETYQISGYGKEN